MHVFGWSANDVDVVALFWHVCLVIQLLLKITVKDHANLIVADHHPLNVHDEWSGSFSIVGTSMTSTIKKLKMALIYQEEGEAEAVQLFAYYTACIICLSTYRAWL